nr:replication protein [Bacillus cereus group sp. BfR-BA-01700]
MSNLLIHEEPLIVLPGLAKAIGLNEAIFLQQVHYWLNKSKHQHDGYYWIYNTYDEWLKQFPFWSSATLRRIVNKLEKQGLLIKGNYNKLKIDQTKWYRIDYDLLDRMSR